jgi:hypothetical protein
VKLTLTLVCLLSAFARTSAQFDALDAAVEAVLTEHRARPNVVFYYEQVGRIVDESIGGIIYLNLKDVQTDETIQGIVELLVVVKRDGEWVALLPGNPNYSNGFNALPPSILQRIDSRPYKPSPDPALVAREDLLDYQFPWVDGQWGTVTRSYGTHGRGQIDFDLGGLDVAAAKDGVVIYANDSHTLNAYNSGAWWYWNVVIIQHAAHEFSIYGHIASLAQAVRDGCTDDYSQPNCNVPVRAGDVIAQEGSTGYSSAPHLHVEFGQQFGIVAYPDLLDEDDDGDRFDAVFAGHVFAEQNVGFRGYEPSEVADWAYGTQHQASHSVTLPANQNLVRNGDFNLGTEAWSPSGQISWRVEDGVMHFMRLNTTEAPDWGLFYQDFGVGAPANTPFEVTFALGNSSGINKTVTVSLLNASGEDYGSMTCAYIVPANTPLQRHTLRGRTQSTWANIRLRVIVNPPDSAPAALMDDVMVTYQPTLEVEQTLCA